MTAPRLLYLAFWYPPSRASGVYRALATTRAFVEAGWEVTVVTVTETFLEDEIGSVDTGLMADVPEQVELIRIPFTSWGTYLGDLRSLSWVGGNFPRLNRRPGNLFPDKYERWIAPVVERSHVSHGETPFNHILATGNPYSSFEAARLLGAGAGIPFSVDFRDPWSFDVFSGSRIRDGRVTEAEARIVDAASFCFHVNPASANAYADAYPGRAGHQLSVRNGYDTDSLGPPRTPSGVGPVKFGVLGTITELWPLDQLFEGWRSARNTLPAGSELILAGHLGYFQQSESILRAKFPGPDEGVRYVGAIPKTGVADFYGGLDVVVVPLFGGPMMTSGKIYEAMGLGLPFICIQAPNGGAREVIVDHPLAIGVDPQAPSIGEAFAKAVGLCRGLTLEEVVEIRSAMDIHERVRAIRPMVEAVNGVGVGG